MLPISNILRENPSPLGKNRLRFFSVNSALLYSIWDKEVIYFFEGIVEKD